MFLSLSALHWGFIYRILILYFTGTVNPEMWTFFRFPRPSIFIYYYYYYSPVFSNEATLPLLLFTILTESLIFFPLLWLFLWVVELRPVRRTIFSFWKWLPSLIQPLSSYSICFFPKSPFLFPLRLITSISFNKFFLWIFMFYFFPLKFGLGFQVYVVYMGSKTGEDPVETLSQDHQMLAAVHTGR